MTAPSWKTPAFLAVLHRRGVLVPWSLWFSSGTIWMMSMFFLHCSLPTSYSLGWRSFDLPGCDTWALAIFIPSIIGQSPLSCRVLPHGTLVSRFPWLQDPELHHLMATAAKAAFDLHTSDEPLDVSEWEFTIIFNVSSQTCLNL